MFVFGGLDGERLNDLYAIKLDIEIARSAKLGPSQSEIPSRSLDEIEEIKNNFKSARKSSEFTEKDVSTGAKPLVGHQLLLLIFSLRMTS
jgi:hypothetical protein